MLFKNHKVCSWSCCVHRIRFQNHAKQQQNKTKEVEAVVQNGINSTCNIHHSNNPYFY